MGCSVTFAKWGRGGRCLTDHGVIRQQIANSLSLRASSNLAKLALLVWVSNFAFELQGKYLVVLFLD